MTSPSPTVPLPVDCVLLEVRYSVNGQDAVNVLAFADSAGTGGGSGATQTFADTALAAWWNAVKPSMQSGCVLTGATARAGSSFGASIAEAVLPTGGVTGTAGAGGIALGLAPVVALRTARGGRSGRGKIYIPGAGGASLGTDNRTVATAWATTLNTALSTFRAGTYAGKVLAVASRTYGVASPVTSLSVRSVIGVQRGRLYG